jgi:DNA modification methylase
MKWDNGVVSLHQADARELAMLADGSVHCVVTSPPYWGLRDYGLGSDGIGLEPTPEAYIANIVAVFQEVRRVLRDDGVLWLNMGDGYSSAWPAPNTRRNIIGNPMSGGKRGPQRQSKLYGVLKELDLINMPHRVASALQADGWYWRSTIVWAKPNPMPESVNGWRWEQCRVKVVKGADRLRDAATGKIVATGRNMTDQARLGMNAQWAPCPGCAKCQDNDGLVLRKGSWRPTSAHEYVFMLTKTGSYYCDTDAVREAHAKGTAERFSYAFRSDREKNYGAGFNQSETPKLNPAGRNLRTVWHIPTQPYPEAHFATFPEALVEPCILAATSERGVCAACGSQWARVVEPSYRNPGNRSTNGPRSTANRAETAGFAVRLERESQTLGWRPTCTCNAATTPATVLDPFAGSGTVGLVAQRLGRRAVLVDLKPEYLELAKRRLEAIPLPLEVPTDV